MISSAIEALYIFNQQNDCILTQTYRLRPPSADTVLAPYLAHPFPRPPLLHLTKLSPPTTLFSHVGGNVFFLVPASTDTDPLFVLEFLHRVVDVLEEFLGAPLLAGKIEGAYDVVAQLLGEMCDAGLVGTTEGNALREVVGGKGWVDKLLGGVGGFRSSTPSLNPTPLIAPPQSQGPAIPWRRANVRHTSNELYVDIVETLSVTLAPSGRPLAAHAHGSIAFTAKISGVPELLLTLSGPGGKDVLARTMELPVFHPCVRLARWKERPGELSFVPPDGKFMLAGYGVDLFPGGIQDALDGSRKRRDDATANLHLPATVAVATSLGATGSEFEVRLLLSGTFAAGNASTTTTTASSSSAIAALSSSLRPPPNLRSGSGRSTPVLGASTAKGTSAGPALEDVVVHVPLPAAVRNVPAVRASRGEATFLHGESMLEWRVPGKEAQAGNAVCRCTVVGPLGIVVDDDDEDDSEEGERAFQLGMAAGVGGLYDESRDGDQQAAAAAASGDAADDGEGAEGGTKKKKKKKKRRKKGEKEERSERKRRDKAAAPDEPPPAPPKKSEVPGRDERKVQANARLMPSAATVSFGVKGWLASGIKVEGLVVDARRSKGLGEGVKPYKGVKYLTVSRRGVEARC